VFVGAHYGLHSYYMLLADLAVTQVQGAKQMLDKIKRLSGSGDNGGTRAVRIIFVCVTLALTAGVIQLVLKDWAGALLRESTNSSTGGPGALALAIFYIAAYLGLVCVMPALVLGAVVSHLLHRYFPPPKRQDRVIIKNLPQFAQLLPDDEKQSSDWRKSGLSNSSSSRITGSDN
jgi:hypothetical protein